jgi:predicted RND superfamily exporter protein
MFETSTLSFMVAPIAVTLCFGLALATLLVLLVIPALLMLLESARVRLQAVIGAQRPTALAERAIHSLNPER